MEDRSIDNLSRGSLGYNLYQYMYDTTDLVIYQKDVPGVSLLYDIPQYLSTAKTYVNDEGFEYVKGTLGTFSVYITKDYLKINSGSLNKFYNGNNMTAFPLPDVQEAFHRIEETLNLPLDLAHVTRFDVAGNFRVKNPVYKYLPLFQRFKRHEKSCFGESGICFSSESQKLVIYDKHKEMRKKPGEFKNIFRFEWRVIHPKKILERDVIVQDLCSPVFWNEMLELWHKRYMAILKLPKIMNDFSTVSGIKDLSDTALYKLLQESPDIYNDLKKAVSNGSMKESTYKSVQKKLKNIVCSPLLIKESSLIEELDSKMKNVVELYKQ